MYCCNCGKENEDGKKFCKYCGNTLANINKEETEVEAPVKIPNKTPDKPLAKIPIETSKNDDSNKGLKAVIIVLSAIVFLLAVILAFYLIKRSSNKDESYKNVTSEITEGNQEEVLEESIINELEDNEITDMQEVAAVEDPAEGALEEAEPELNEEVEEENEEDIAEMPEIIKLAIAYAEASSELNVKSKDNATYFAGNAVDGDFKTAWVEGDAGCGEGHVIVLHLDGVYKVSKLKIYTGFLKSWARYVKNGKVTNVLIDYGNGQVQQVALNYNTELPEEEIDFDESTLETCATEIYTERECETDTIRITIINAVAGSKYEDTAVSEIEVYGN